MILDTAERKKIFIPTSQISTYGDWEEESQPGVEIAGKEAVIRGLKTQEISAPVRKEQPSKIHL